MRRKNKRDEILKAAIKVYGYYGFEGATIEKIASQAGVSRALVMRYYKSKQELVKAIVNYVAQNYIEKLQYLDVDEKLTFRQREEKIFQILKPGREEWCLLIGTLLVPDFQFQLRGDITKFLTDRHKENSRYLKELRTPSADALFSLSYSINQLRTGYILDGKQENYLRARDYLLDLYLLPEEEIKKI